MTSTIKQQVGFDEANDRVVSIQIFWDKHTGYGVEVSYFNENGEWRCAYQSDPYYSGPTDKNLLACYRRQVRKYPQTEALQLAMAFGLVLRTWLTPAQMNDLINLNTGETDPGICHSHDYCDSNMAMAFAFIGITGRHFTFFDSDKPETEKQHEIDTDLTNKAWQLANFMDFMPLPNPIMVSVELGEPITLFQFIGDNDQADPDQLDIVDVNDLRNAKVGDKLTVGMVLVQRTA